MISGWPRENLERGTTPPHITHTHTHTPSTERIQSVQEICPFTLPGIHRHTTSPGHRFYGFRILFQFVVLLSCRPWSCWTEGDYIIVDILFNCTMHLTSRPSGRRKHLGKFSTPHSGRRPSAELILEILTNPFRIIWKKILYFYEIYCIFLKLIFVQKCTF